MKKKNCRSVRRLLRLTDLLLKFRIVTTRKYAEVHTFVENNTMAVIIHILFINNPRLPVTVRHNNKRKQDTPADITCKLSLIHI